MADLVKLAQRLLPKGKTQAKATKAATSKVRKVGDGVKEYSRDWQDVIAENADAYTGFSDSFGKGRHYHNFYSGFKPTKRLTATGMGLFGAYGIGASTLAVTNPEKAGEVSYVGTAPALQADAVQNTTSAPTLGASGSMVFGLHNNRRG